MMSKRMFIYNPPVIRTNMYFILDEVQTNGSYGNDDLQNEIGSRSSLNQNLEMTNLEFDHWQMNYHESAIYLEEGRNNEKFDSHPTHPSALPAYLLVHNSWYYGLDLATSVLLLLLALVESPAVPLFEVFHNFILSIPDNIR